MPLDNMLIEHIQPALASVYLSTHGWRVAETRPDKSTRWIRAAGEPGELILPTDSMIGPEIADQKRDFVNALAAIEALPPRDILMMLVHAGADHLRVNLQRPETSRGTLALDNATRLSQGLNRLLTAMAWAMLEPGPFLSGKKPTQVSRYARTLEIGPAQAESGYTIHVLSPLGDMDQDSVSRGTLLALVHTLGAVRMALEAHTFSPERVGPLVEQFVTADLCEALVLVLGKPATRKRGRTSSTSTREVRFSFEWSPALPVPAGTPNEVMFESEVAERLKELAEQLQETPPQENFQLQGRVIDLKRSERTGVGKVTVSNQNRDALAKVSMELEPEQYDLAIQAHRDESAVLCIGTLVRDKRTYVLVNPSLAPVDGQAFQSSTRSGMPEKESQ